MCKNIRAFMLQGIIWTVAICAGVPFFFETKTHRNGLLVSRKKLMRTFSDGSIATGAAGPKEAMSAVYIYRLFIDAIVVNAI